MVTFVDFPQPQWLPRKTLPSTKATESTDCSCVLIHISTHWESLQRCKLPCWDSVCLNHTWMRQVLCGLMRGHWTTLPSRRMYTSKYLLLELWQGPKLSFRQSWGNVCGFWGEDCRVPPKLVTSCSWQIWVKTESLDIGLWTKILIPFSLGFLTCKMGKEELGHWADWRGHFHSDAARASAGQRSVLSLPSPPCLGHKLSCQ